MSCILFVTARALGHVSRMLSIAAELRENTDTEIVFVAPTDFNFAGLVSAGGFRLFGLQWNARRFNGVPMDLGTFSEGLERLIDDLAPKAIVYDCPPMQYLSTMRWPSVPRILITNVFLTSAGGEDTLQQRTFKKAKGVINTRRRSLGMDPVDSATDMYEADLVCLADPHILVKQFKELPENFRSCGASFWESDEQLPPGAPTPESTILFSMGSTGWAEITSDLVAHLKKVAGASSAIYVGSDADEVRKSGVVDYAATMLPLQQYFPKTKLVVTQGGAGSTYQALSHGLPSAILPSHRNHHVMGEILEKLGLIAFIPSADSLSSFTADVFNKIAGNAHQYANDMSERGGTKKIAREIGAFMEMKTSETTGRATGKSRRSKAVGLRKFRYANASHASLASNAQHNFALRHTMQIFASNACCTWIPKNACSTLRFSIAKANGCVSDLSDINWIHNNNQAFNATTESAFRASYIFTVLRCPYARLYSVFMDKLVNFDNPAWKFYTSTGRAVHPHDITFKDFILKLKDQNPANFDIHWRRQVDFLLFKNYDDIFSLENLTEMSETVKNRIGLDIVDTRGAIGHETSGNKINSDLQEPFNISALDLLNNSKSGFRPNPEAMFDPQMVAAVQALYKRDLSLYQKQFGNSLLMNAFG